MRYSSSRYNPKSTQPYTDWSIPTENMTSKEEHPSYRMSVTELKKTLENVEEYQKMLRGELYYSFNPEMTWARRRCAIACRKYNAAEDPTRREQVAMWREYVHVRRIHRESHKLISIPAFWETPSLYPRKHLPRRKMTPNSAAIPGSKVPSGSTMASTSPSGEIRSSALISWCSIRAK